MHIRFEAAHVQHRQMLHVYTVFGENQNSSMYSYEWFSLCEKGKSVNERYGILRWTLLCSDPTPPPNEAAIPPSWPTRHHPAPRSASFRTRMQFRGRDGGEVS